MGIKLHSYNDNPPRQYFFHCPGCKIDHGFTVGEPKRGPEDPRWEFNGSFELPTFTPSLLCNRSFPDSICHSFVIDGKIQFLGDCHHELRETTVELPDWENW